MMIVALGTLLVTGAYADTTGERLAEQAAALGFSSADAQTLKKDVDQAIFDVAPYRTKSMDQALPASVGKVLDDMVLLSPRYGLTADKVLLLMVEFAVGINEVSNAPDTNKIRKAFVPMQSLFEGKGTPGADLLRLYGPMMKDGLAETLSTEPAHRTAPPPSKGMAETLRTARRISDFAKKNGISTTELLSASKALEAGMGR